MLRVVMILMLCACGDWAVAQDNDDQKDQSEEQTRRPSWSSGLPERQKTESMTRPDLSKDFQDDLTIDRSELGLERPVIEMPEADMEQQAEPQEEPAIAIDSSEEPVSDDETPVDEVPVEQQPVVAEPEPAPAIEPDPEPVPEIEPATYEWLVIEQAEVNFPSRGIRNQINGWVDVEVTLNPQGDVVSAQTVDFSDEAGIYVEAAEESLQNWVFQPPQEQGVTELVSKVFRVDFVPPEIEQPISKQVTTASDESADVDEMAEEVIVGDQNTIYQWQVLNQVPLDYPSAAARKRLEGWVDIIVTINPDGEVISLQEERYSSRGKIFVDSAKNALQQWQFEPPKNQDINTNVSRSYRIEFKL
jgi:TonB family protein